LNGDMKRFNDGIADPEGCVFAGAAGLDNARGASHIRKPPPWNGRYPFTAPS